MIPADVPAWVARKMLLAGVLLAAGLGALVGLALRLCVKCEQQEAAEEVVLQGELWD